MSVPIHRARLMAKTNFVVSRLESGAGAICELRGTRFRAPFPAVKNFETQVDYRVRRDTGDRREGALDAAHIVVDADEQSGQPIVSNGLPVTKIHHAVHPQQRRVGRNKKALIQNQINDLPVNSLKYME
jgi:hypothetical protein